MVHLAVAAALAAAATMAPVVAAPSNPAPLRAAALSLRQGDPLGAAALLQPALEAALPAPPTARLLAAEAALLLGQAEVARQRLEGLEAALPEVADWIWLLRARAARQRFDWPAASVAYQATLRHLPRSPFAQEAALGLADGHYVRGQAAAARAAYGRALRLRPEGPAAGQRALLGRLNLAALLAAQGATRAAAKQLREVSRQDADGEATRLAQQQLRRLSPQRPAFAAAAAEIELLLGKRHLNLAAAALAEAAPLATEAAQRDRLQAAAAQLKLRQHDFAGAIALWTPLLGRSRGEAHLEVGRSLAGALSQAQQNSAAILIWSDLAARAPRGRIGRDAAFRAAWLTYNGGDLPQAHRLFGRLLQAHPQDAQASETTWLWAWTAYRSGQFEAAAHAFDQLARRLRRWDDPERAGRLHYWRGQTYVRLGELALAKASFGRAAKSPWSYYGLLARRRLEALQAPVQNFASLGEAGTAAVAPMAAATATATGLPVNPLAGEAPLPTHLARAAAAGPAALPTALPPGPALPQPPAWEQGPGAALSWRSPVGRRLSIFLELGLPQLASRLVSQLPTKPGTRAVAACRTHAFAALGDAAAAYRLASSAFARQLEGPLDAATRPRFEWAYPAAHAATVQAAVAEFGGSTELVLAIMRQESGFDAEAHSSADARGLMQVIPPTGRQIAAALKMGAYTDAALLQPQLNLRFGAWYLAQLLHEFCGNLVPAIASYNAGPQAVKNWLAAHAAMPSADTDADAFVEDIPYRQTRQYVKSVLANYAVYARLYGPAGAEPELPRQVPRHWRGNINF